MRRLNFREPAAKSVRTIMIELADLEEMFANIKAETDWDLSKPMLWGYFFTDPSPAKLEAIVPDLEMQGFRFANLYPAEVEEEDDEYFILHIEKEEVHNPKTLHKRNQKLYALAEQHRLASYDGMDVGPIGE